MLYRKRSPSIEAVQWHKNGDHPKDESVLINIKGMPPFLSEGKFVRRFRRLDVSGSSVCRTCSATFTQHGWIDSGEEGHIVCPGDFIVSRDDGGCEIWKPDLFNKQFEEVYSK